MNYRVDPGLYALGKPTQQSPVFVTANYKLTFDLFRRAVSPIDGWVLVLDTLGINVWCAAGKGTFGTDELVDRIEASGLADIVSHRKLIVPQLGAPGIAAYEVKRRSGFHVTYGPVQAEDLPAFLRRGLKAEGRMRTKDFGVRERLALAPMEVVPALKITLPVLAGLLVLFLIVTGFSVAGAFSFVLIPLVSVGFAILAGAVFTPLLLPFLPFRAFSLKGLIVGFLAALVASFAIGSGHHQGVMAMLALLLLISSMSAYLAMNFTGSSTFTSLSGVRKEMRYALPLEIGGTALGLALWIISIVGG
jgi:hypothetical protein